MAELLFASPEGAEPLPHNSNRGSVFTFTAAISDHTPLFSPRTWQNLRPAVIYCAHTLRVRAFANMVQ